MQREGPRLEKLKHEDAERRVRASVLRRERGEPWAYEGREEDLALIRRKRHEGREARLGPVEGGGGAS